MQLTRMITRRFLPLAAAMCLACPVQANALQILINPGFETGDILPWTNTTDILPWTATSAEAHSGTFSATTVGTSILSQSIAPTSTDAITQISLWLKQPEAAIAQVVFRYRDGLVNSAVLDTITTGWEFFDVTSKLLPNETLVTFEVNGYRGGGPAEDRTYVDDLLIDAPPVPEPSTLLLLGSGLAGVCLMGRRKKEL